MKLNQMVTIVFLIVALSQGTLAQTEVGGEIASDTTWSLTGSPYLAVESVRVLAGVTLSIEPGVKVKFDSPCSLRVGGILIARGTASDSIVFTSNTTSPQPGDWGGILFDSTSVDATFDSLGNYLAGTIIEYCRVEYGEEGIRCDQSSPFIHLNLITANSISGISCYGSSPRIVGNRIEGNGNPLKDYGGGILCTSSSPLILENLICANSAQNGGGISSYGRSDPRILNNLIEGNWAQRGGGVCCLFYPAASVLLSGNQIRGNTAADFGGGIYTTGSVAWDINGNKIIGNSATNGGGIYCSSSSRLMNLSHNTIGYNLASQNGGALYCSSSALTISENSIIHNSASSSGGGIYTSGISVYHFPLSIIQNNITGNYAAICGGIYSADSTYLVMHYNNLVNTAGFEVYLNGAGEIVEADSNWWGTTNLDSIEGRIYDSQDDTNLADVHFLPFLTLPAIGNPLPVHSLRLKSDSTYSQDLTTNLWIGAKMWIQLEGQDSDSLVRDQTTVSLRGNFTDTVGIQVVLTETDSVSGVFRGVAKVDSMSVEDVSIAAVLGESLMVISNVDSTKFIKVLVGKEGVDERNRSLIPKEFVLFQNYPNPFNATTVIRYSLIVDRHQQSEEGGSRARATSTLNVSLKVYNIAGQEVRTLVEERQGSGRHQVVWDGRDNEGKPVASGVYLCRLKAESRKVKAEMVRKMMVLK